MSKAVEQNSGATWSSKTVELNRERLGFKRENAADVCVVGNRGGEDDGGRRMEDGDGAWR